MLNIGHINCGTVLGDSCFFDTLFFSIRVIIETDRLCMFYVVESLSSEYTCVFQKLVALLTSCRVLWKSPVI